MATAEDVRRLALSLAGTVARPHVDRTAFAVRRIYATLAPNGASVNLMFDPAEQEFKCLLAPDVFTPAPGGWGRMGITTALLSRISEDELLQALTTAWRRASAPPNRRRKLDRTR